VSGDAQRWRTAFEAATAARGRHEVLREVHADYERRCLAKEKTAADLRKQIEGLRAQLQRYGEALENELAAGREAVAHRVREALLFEKTFADCSALLQGQLQGKPEVSELFEELKREEATQALNTQGPGSIRADQTGSFKAMG
jgi:serine/threonine-protein kinase